MKTTTWLVAACLATSLPAQAQLFKPIEIKDQELAELRGRYVMPGRIISFGVVMSSTWQNAAGDRIGATTTLQVQQNTFKPQFYVSMSGDNGSGAAPGRGNGLVNGGAGLVNTQGVTQSVRAAGDNNSAYNDVAINVSEGGKAPTAVPQGQVLAAGTTLTNSNNAGTLSVSNTGKGIQMSIQANNNQGQSLQRLSNGGLLQTTTLLGGSNAVNNLTQLNVVLRDNLPSAGALNCNLDQLKGLRISGY
ncbi:hypothetical protein NJF44_12245 [Pseudomonas guariconensis]|uniref:hypothetical protein n=1 Tax=Pseudomonas TaxID=286 RepID=UPI001CE48557|nr:MULTISPECIES: hypothetical protein [Pseudomonas]MCO7639040.1 hypothetical protein [Pseudomonas sp. S 311-6]MCO7514322.1 hypothetical protein [Pseudomonas putida]MCO7564863.1 hypothetical protein [Pseudomonas mosselii]MCO7593760.1 hypothetical protein [Pseudomonas guariconensis]MCO7606005.1 hypothetical protein [Pseudomonas guariconensis]